MKNLYAKTLLFCCFTAFLLFRPISSKAFFEDFFSNLENIISNVETQTSSGDSDSNIINKVNVSTNTGGNTAESGQVIEGESKSTIEVENTINGTQVDPIDIETDASEVEVKSEIKADGHKATVDREIDIDGEKTEESYEVDLGNTSESLEQASEQEPSGESEINNNLSFVGQLWSNLVQNIKNIFGKIFSIF